MPLTLYTAFVPSALQVLGATSRLLDKLEAHCHDTGMDAADLIGTRLIDDMLPFSYQVKSVAVHSAGAIHGVQEGIFRPDTSPPPTDVAGLRERLDTARDTLENIGENDLEDLAGAEVVFALGETRLPFTGQEFLLSFSQPNFYFHTATAYDILRMKGLPLGKRDYLGRLRFIRD